METGIASHVWSVEEIVGLLNEVQSGMKPAWFRIAASFPEGATIPYLLKSLRVQRGAGDLLTVEDCKTELRSLLVALSEEMPAPQVVALKQCSTIEAIVVCVKSKGHGSFSFIPSKSGLGSGLFHAIGFAGSDIEALSERLWNEHADCILGRKFSREPIAQSEHNEHEWVAFSDAECEWVRRIMGQSKRP